MYKEIILSILILMAATIMSIGYAAINMSFDITGTVNAKAQEDIFVIEPIITNTTNAKNEIEINQIYKTILDSTISLNNSGDDYSITYKVTVYNNTQIDYAFKGIIADNTTYDNSQINYSYEGINLNDVLKKGQSTTFSITLSNSTSSKNELRSFMNISFKKAKAYLNINGLNLATKMKTLANDGILVDGYSTDTNINAIKFATKAQYEAKASNLTADNKISSSSPEVYIWFENNTIYFYSEADTICMSGNAEKTFCKMTNLTDVSALEYFNTSSVTDMNRMFQDSTKITDLSPIANWDVSNVTDMTFMFGANVGSDSSESAYMHITSLEPLRNWNVSKNTSLNQTFKGCKYVSTLESLENWDVSSVTNFKQTFNRTGLVDATSIVGWDVRAGTTFEMMLANISSLPNTKRPIFTLRPGSWNSSGTYTPST